MDIVGLPYEWTVEEPILNDDNTAIYAYCLDKNSNPILVRFESFPIFCYIELPSFVSGKYISWNETKATIFMEWMNKTLKEDACINWQFTPRKKLYYYRNDGAYPMLLVMFRNSNCMNHMMKLITKPKFIEGLGTIVCNVWETDIPLVRKLLTQRKLGYTQWFKTKAIEVSDEDRVSIYGKRGVEKEYIADWRTLDPIDAEESKTWNTTPKILSWDIECFSANENAMPKPHNATDVCYMISMVFSILGKPESRKRYGLVFGECPPSERPNTITICVKSESALLFKFKEIIMDENPDILIGYNILSFDYPYINTRLTRKLDDWGEMGRIANKLTEYVSFSWESSMYGTNEICFLNMPGRISIDLLPIVKREYKLDQYNLNTVSNKFLGRGKHDVPPKEMFRIYREHKKLISRKGLPTEEDKVELDKNKQELLTVLEYALEDSELVIDLFDKLNIWIIMLETASIEGVSIMSLFTRGQQIRHLSQLYHHCFPLGIVIDKRLSEYMPYQGAYVADPVPGLYENVICLDFASLYPSIMRAFNICYTTLVPKEMYDQVPIEHCHVFDFDTEVPIEPIKNTEEEKDTDIPDHLMKEESPKKEKAPKTKIVHYHHRFIKQEYFKGVLPSIVEGLVNERNRVRKQQEVEKDPVYKVVLDKRQLALKVSANSKYGALGAQTGKRPFVEGAMCVTAKGRELIHFVNEYLKEKYKANIVYNDTDSVFIDMKIPTPQETDKLGHELSKEVSSLFPPPLKMEFEKAMRVFVIKKKKYAAFLLGKDGKYKETKAGMLRKGILTARRDNCKWAREFYDELLFAILTNKDVYTALDIIRKNIEKLLSPDKKVEDFTIIKGLAANYKSESFSMNIFGQKLRANGKIANGGDRLAYVVVEGEAYPDKNEPITDSIPKHKLSSDGKDYKLGYKMLLDEDFNSDKRLDVEYYLEKQCMNPIEQIFSIAYGTSFKRYYVLNSTISLSQPIKAIDVLLKNNMDIEKLNNMVVLE